jgi:hypothetical protein
MVLAAGCGGSRRAAGFLDRERLEGAVRLRVEQGLMTSSPRQRGARSPTHVRQVDCEPSGDRRFRCTAVLATGARTSWSVLVAADGRTFSVERM